MAVIFPCSKKGSSIVPTRTLMILGKLLSNRRYVKATRRLLSAMEVDKIATVCLAPADADMARLVVHVLFCCQSIRPRCLNVQSDGVCECNYHPMGQLFSEGTPLKSEKCVSLYLSIAADQFYYPLYLRASSPVNFSRRVTCGLNRDDGCRVARAGRLRRQD